MGGEPPIRLAALAIALRYASAVSGKGSGLVSRDLWW